MDLAAIIQTVVICFTFLGGIFMVYSKLDNKASIALSKAKDAEHKAERVENTVNGMQRELVKIRTVLEERLPKKS